jgi:alkylation response protein AidB-like acyl-CoA dehydrogenase
VRAMNFDFGENELSIAAKVRALLGPDSKDFLARGESGDLQQTRDSLLQWMNRLAKAGYFAPGLQDGKNSVALVASRETLAAVAPSLFLSAEVSTRLFGRLIAVYGTTDQKASLLPAVQGGRLIGAVGLSETGMNLESSLETVAVPAGHDFLVSGTKGHVVNAPIADWIAVAGNTNERLAFFLLKADHQGLSIGRRLSTVGYNGIPISALSFERCSVSSRNCLGPFEDDEPLRKVRSWEDEILTAASLGLMRTALDTASEYARAHRSGGKPIIAYQEIGFKLAEMLTLLQTAQLLAYRSAWMAETGDREAELLGHCAKVFCAESAERVTSASMQILGQQGYLRGNPAEEGYRNAKYLQIAGTSTEISRVKIGDGVMERG